MNVAYLSGFLRSAARGLILSVLVGFLPSLWASGEEEPISPPDATSEAEFEAIVKRTEEIRGLSFKQPVPFNRMGKQELTDFIQKEFERHYSPADWNHIQASLVLLGAIPEGLRLDEFLFGLLAEQVAGLYDPRTKEMYVVGDLSLKVGLTQIVLEHELTHALTDQHFDLLKLPIEAIDDDDRMMAASALVEGDATLSMAEYAQDLGFAGALTTIVISLFTDQETFGAAPSYYQAAMLFPYLGGEMFLLQVGMQEVEGDRLVPRKGARKSKGLINWKAVDFAYSHPPESTEQILHPEKYIEGNDPPLQVDLRDVPFGVLGLGWTWAWENTLGEFLLKTLLLDRLSAIEAVDASEGWGGDRYLLATHADGRTAFFWRTVWDTEYDALEFRTACLKLIETEAFGGPTVLLPFAEGRPREVCLWIVSDETLAKTLSEGIHR